MFNVKQKEKKMKKFLCATCLLLISMMAMATAQMKRETYERRKQMAKESYERTLAEIEKEYEERGKFSPDYHKI